MSFTNTISGQQTFSSSTTMSLKRLLNDDDDDDYIQYPDPLSISPYGSVSGSSYQSIDEYDGNHPRPIRFQGSHYPQQDQDQDPEPEPELESSLQHYDSYGRVVQDVLFNQSLGEQMDSLDLSADDVNFNFLGLEQWGQQQLAMESPNASYASQPSPSGSASSRDSLPATHPPSLMHESSVTGSDSSSSFGDEDVDKVCYGMLHNVEVKLIGDMAVIDTKLHERLRASTAAGRSHQHFTIAEQSEHVLLAFQDGTDFGYLRSSPAKTVTGLLGEPAVEFEPVAPAANLRETIARAKKSSEAMVKVDINVYGPRRAAQKVGDGLSEGKLWLQKPAHPRPAVDYENPHLLRLDGVECQVTVGNVRDVAGGQGHARRQPREDGLKKMMREVYESLRNTRNIDQAEGVRGLRHPLLQHQREALAFMLERESGDISEAYRLWEHIEKDDGQKWYRHRITKAKQKTKPEEKGGGILADEMGMGKSLSILSLIVKTLNSGRVWAEEENNSEERSKDMAYSGATLVVVSSALLIANWEAEVDKHVEGGLTYVKYHGPGRETEIDKIKNTDIVVTTYNTLSAEFDRKESRLHKLGWYRVVLDEAHIIRRPATTFYQACRALQANSRWCLTGTPIQNKLSDIGALFAFIRANPFDDPRVFRRHIEIPFEQNGANPDRVKEYLITLLDSLCLRRTQDLLRLPGLVERKRELDLGPEERERYDKTRRTVLRMIRHKVGEVERSSKFGLFQANLQMRILCNHGTYQKPFSWNRRAYNRHDRLSEREAVVSALGQDAEIICSGCHQPMSILGSSKLRNDFEEQCAHVICHECIDYSELSSATSPPPQSSGVEAEAGAGAGARTRSCPVCENWIRSARSQRTLPVVRLQPATTSGGGGDVDMLDAPAPAASREDDEDYFYPSGKSTKMEHLTQDVKENLQDTKSIIFSCWTRTLRLVEKYLRAAGIEHLRIDGDCSLPERQARLKEFADSDDKRVLIMTTGTGAFGLNLTCANRVFIVELQWNPSVENQAIARAIRLGQGREVLVTRYVMKDTVEVEMSSQQSHKKNLAAIGFDDYEAAEMDETHD